MSYFVALWILQNVTIMSFPRVECAAAVISNEIRGNEINCCKKSRSGWRHCFYQADLLQVAYRRIMFAAAYVFTFRHSIAFGEFNGISFSFVINLQLIDVRSAGSDWINKDTRQQPLCEQLHFALCGCCHCSLLVWFDSENCRTNKHRNQMLFVHASIFCTFRSECSIPVCLSVCRNCRRIRPSILLFVHSFFSALLFWFIFFFSLSSLGSIHCCIEIVRLSAFNIYATQKNSVIHWPAAGRIIVISFFFFA